MVNDYIYKSPMGPLAIRLEGDAISRIRFDRTRRGTPLPSDHPIHKALDHYFETGEGLGGLPVVVNGSEFQRAVWNALGEVPRGEVRTYSWMAARIGRPGAARAVGTALGANPVPIVVPCHRVVATTGLGGYGGGLGWKDYLLKLEGYSALASSERSGSAPIAAGF